MGAKIRNTFIALALLVLATFFSFSAVSFPQDQSAADFLYYSALITSAVSIVTAVVWISIEGATKDATLRRPIEDKINAMIEKAREYRDSNSGFIRTLEALAFIVLVLGLLLTHAVGLAVFVTLAGMLDSYINQRKIKAADGVLIK